MCEVRIKCRCLTSFDFFFFKFLTLGQFNARISTYFDQDFQIYLADSEIGKKYHKDFTLLS